MPRSLWVLVRPYVAAIVAVLPVGALAIHRVLTQAGEPALPLDDAFIHLQYARRLAEGHWFSYVPGAGYSSGATSLLWPLVLAPFFAAGVQGLQAVWVVWALGALAHAGVVVEAHRLASGLAGRLAGFFAGALCTVFGAFAWFAYSGMETVPFAWILLRCVRVAAELCETRHASRRQRVEVALLGLAAPLLRPEGALASLVCAVALWRGERGCRPGRPPATRIPFIALPLTGPLFAPALHWLLTGSAASSTARVKWLALDPYLDASGLAAAAWSQARFLWSDLLQGGGWTILFLPPGFGLWLLGGAVSVVVLGTERGRRWVGAGGSLGIVSRPRRAWRSFFLLALIAGTFIPSSYATLLWNRVRYLWPFAPAWLVAIACGGALLGSLATRLRPALGAVAPGLLGAWVALLAIKLPWATFDLAQSARAIAKQQVELGRWAAVLPPDALIGVNDTGAIAYLSRRRTFDLVGLTTPGEARYWVAGAGSRFEHYERLGAERLPSHFIVYPHWMACPAVLGPELHRRTVFSQSILGGPTMVAYQARYDLLHSGARPFSQRRYGELLDELDVADLESEQRHDFVLGAASAADNRAVMWPTPDGRVVADGGRFGRLADHFTLTVPPGTPTALVARVVTAGGLVVRVGTRSRGQLASEDQVVSVEPPSDPATWSELAFELPPLAAAVDQRRAVEVSSADGSEFASFHYWLLRRDVGLDL